MNQQRYNKHKKRLITLRDGEEFCTVCHGEGMVASKRNFLGIHKKGRLLVCKKCMGDGKVDWIEKATGKRPRRISGTDASPRYKRENTS